MSEKTTPTLSRHLSLPSLLFHAVRAREFIYRLLILAASDRVNRRKREIEKHSGTQESLAGAISSFLSDPVPISVSRWQRHMLRRRSLSPSLLPIFSYPSLPPPLCGCAPAVFAMLPSITIRVLGAPACVFSIPGEGVWGGGVILFPPLDTASPRPSLFLTERPMAIYGRDLNRHGQPHSLVTLNEPARTD